MQRSFLPINVLEAAKRRIRRLYAEFDHVLVTISGGKDSTVIYHLTLDIAEELGRLPVPVFFIDQEAEWETVIDHVRDMMHDDRVEPYWLQVPILISNSASTDPSNEWLRCWYPGEPWMREREPDSIYENKLGTDRFKVAFTRLAQTYFPTGKTAVIAGVRVEESYARLSGLTNQPCYKDITWGNKHGKSRNSFTFYPLYDWTYVDVWKAIHDHGWAYCKLYDYMYQYGRSIRDMRVSNVHHETAVHTLDFMQEIEPDTWNKLLQRLFSVHSVSKVYEAYMCPKKLPEAFVSWREYRDYLLVHLVDPARQDRFRRMFVVDEKLCLPSIYDKMMKMHVASILVNDFHGTKQEQFHSKMKKHLKRTGRLRTWKR
jgi:predicted phosphoadenosine phosphosulfate sulfurtransferase